MPPRSSVRKVIGSKDSTQVAKGKQSASKISGQAKMKPSENANQILKNRPVFTTPKSDLNQDIGLQRSIPSVYSTGDYGQIMELQALTSVSDDKFNDLLRQKLQQCRIICNFTDPMADLKSKSIKQSYLQEINDFLCQTKYYRMMEHDTIQALIQMVKSNIIRSLPPIPDLAKVPMIGDDINDTIYESAWPHLEIVYQIFLHFLENSLLDIPTVEHNIDSSFISKFMLLFNSSDQREREVLKLVLHKLYLKFTTKRQLIRQVIHHIFYTYIYETRYFPGINELLEIMISIINGYAVPLKQEHKDFLIKILLPLHTSNFLHTFHQNLVFSVQQYIKKDPDLIPIVIRRLLELWPVTCSWKELIFLSELVKIFDVMSEEQFVMLMDESFPRIGLCIDSDNFQVSESAMLLWKNDKFINFIRTNSKEIYPIICPFLYSTGTKHWNAAIKNLAVSVIRICLETSPSIFEEFGKGMKLRQQQNQQKIDGQRQAWIFIHDVACSQETELRTIPIQEELEEIFPKASK